MFALLIWGCQEQARRDLVDATIDLGTAPEDVGVDATYIDLDDCERPAARPAWAEAMPSAPRCTPATFAQDCAQVPYAVECAGGRCCGEVQHPRVCFECVSDAECGGWLCIWGQCHDCWTDCECQARGRGFCVPAYHADDRCAECTASSDCPVERPFCEFLGIDNSSAACVACRMDADCPPERPRCDRRERACSE